MDRILHIYNSSAIKCDWHCGGFTSNVNAFCPSFWDHLGHLITLFCSVCCIGSILTSDDYICGNGHTVHLGLNCTGVLPSMAQLDVSNHDVTSRTLLIEVLDVKYENIYIKKSQWAAKINKGKKVNQVKFIKKREKQHSSRDILNNWLLLFIFI